MKVSQGEAFDPAPANIEKHLTRVDAAGRAEGRDAAEDEPRRHRVGVTANRFWRRESRWPARTRSASMTGSLLMRGTKNKTRQQIQDEMVKLNARINVSGERLRGQRNHPDDRRKSDSGTAAGGRDVARAGVPGFRVRLRRRSSASPESRIAGRSRQRLRRWRYGTRAESVSRRPMCGT